MCCQGKKGLLGILPPVMAAVLALLATEPGKAIGPPSYAGFTGSVNMDWGTVANWNTASPGTIGEYTTAIFNNSPSNAYGAYPYAPAYTTVGHLQIGSSEWPGGSGELHVAGGMLTVTDRVFIGDPMWYGPYAGYLSIEGGTLLSQNVVFNDLDQNTELPLTRDWLHVSGGVLDLGQGGSNHSIDSLIPNFSFTGGTIQNLSTARITAISGNGTVSNLTGTLTLDLINSSTFTGSISGSGASGKVAKTGAGVLTLSPGGSGAATATNLAGLTSTTNVKFNFDLTTPGGSGDLITIGAGGWIVGPGTQISLNALPTALGNYRLFAGNLGAPGPANFLLPAPPNSEIAYYLSTSADPGYLSLVVANSTGSTWTAAAGDGKWGTGGNWDKGMPGTGTTLNDTAVFGPGGSGTVALNAAWKLGGLVLNNASSSYTIGQPGDTGSITMELFASGSSATINASAGNHTIAAPIALNSNLDVTVAGGSGLAVAGVVSGGKSLTKKGDGTLILGGANSYTGGTIAAAGLLQLGVQGGVPDNTALTVAGGTLDLGGFTTTTTAAVSLQGGLTQNGVIVKNGGSYDGQAGTVSAALQGTAGLVKTGGGTLVLSGSNAYSGGTTVAAGKLQLGAQGGVPDNTALTVTGGTLDLGGLTKTTSAAVSFQGGLTQNGTIVNNGAAYDGQAGTVSATLQGTAGLTKTGSGTLVLSGNNTYSGSTTVTGGILDLGGFTKTTAAGFSFRGGLTQNGSIVNNGAAYDAQAGTVSATLRGTAGLAKTGIGTLLLSAANTYSGGTTLSGGTVQVGVNSVGSVGAIASSAIGTGALTFSGGGISSDGATARTILNPVAFSAGGSAALGDGYNPQNNGALNFSAGVDLGTTNHTITVRSLTQFAGIVTGSGGFTKAGYNTLTLSAANTYTGGTTISDGTVTLSGPGTLGAPTSGLTINGGQLDLGGTTQTVGAVSITSVGNHNFITNGSLRATSYSIISSIATCTITVSLSGSGALSKTGDSETILSGANSYAGGTVLNSGSIWMGSDPVGSVGAIVSSAIGTGVLTFNGGGIASYSKARTILNPVAFTAGGNGVIGAAGANSASTFSAGVDLGTTSHTITVKSPAQFAGVVSGAGGGLTKAGTSTLTLSAANTYTGGTTVAAGVLQLGVQDGLPDNTALTVTGGTLNLGGFTKTNTAAVSFQGGTTQNGTMVNNGVAYDGQGGTVLASLQGAAGLAKTGSGTLLLSGANTYSGGTTLSGGTLQIGSDPVGAVGSITSSAIGTGVLTFSGGCISSDGTTPRNILNPVAFSTGGGGILGDATKNGTLTFSAGVDLGTTNHTITVNSPVQFAGTVSGDGGGFSKAGTGILTLSAANTYAGGTTISAGTVAASGSGTLGAATCHLTLGGGALDLGGTSQTVGAVSITAPAASGDTIRNGSIAGASYAASNTSAVVVSADLLAIGLAGLTKSGAGILTLTGANTYSGGTTLSGGTVQIGSNSSGSVGSIVSSAIGTGLLTFNGGAISSNGTTARTVLNPVAFSTGGSTTFGDSTRNGLLTFRAGIDLGSTSRTLTVSSPVEFAGSVSGTGGFSKAGTGTLTLSGANSYTGGTTVTAGTLVLGNADALPLGRNVTVNTGTTVRENGNLGNAVQVGGLTVNGTGKFDLSGGKLIVNGAVTSQATVRGYLAAGYHSGDWNGSGITSSWAAADPVTYAVGYLRNGDLGDLAYTVGSDQSAPAAWFGRSATADSIFVRLTYAGDADLSGEVTTDDFDLWKYSYAETLPATWHNGDLDYSGMIDTDDFDIWKYSYSFLYPPLDYPFAAAVPEPSTVALLSIGAVGLLAIVWQRRKSR